MAIEFGTCCVFIDIRTVPAPYLGHTSTSTHTSTSMHTSTSIYINTSIYSNIDIDIDINTYNIDIH